MTHVITEPCIGVKDASCVDVCPVDCIHSDPDAEMFFIDPAVCIDCTACVDVCPVYAIYADTDLPEALERFLGVNAEYYGRATTP